jgi:hypothetical protein
MSPGVPSYRAERGSDINKLHEAIFDALTKAQAAVQVTTAPARAATCAAIAQAAAIAALAAQVGRVADAIEADNATAPALPMPVDLPAPFFCPQCGDPRGFGVVCNAAADNGRRCGCSHSFHNGGAQ